MRNDFPKPKIGEGIEIIMVDFFVAGRGASRQAFPRRAWERESSGVQGVPYTE